MSGWGRSGDAGSSPGCGLSTSEIDRVHLTGHAKRKGLAWPKEAWGRLVGVASGWLRGMGDIIASRVGVTQVLLIVRFGYDKHEEGQRSWTHHLHTTARMGDGRPGRSGASMR